jgi:hypothetical protein
MSTCKACLKDKQKAYYEENKAKCLESSKEYAKKHINETRETKRRWKKNNPEYVKAENAKRAPKIKAWRQKNRVRINEKNIARRKNDVCFKIRCYLRSRLSAVIRGNVKNGSAIKDLGCTLDELKTYLQEKFQPNRETGEEMTFDNYGKWHIDHIMPLSAFNLTDPEQLKKACHYTNLQPLWAKDNISKGGTNRRDYGIH